MIFVLIILYRFFVFDNVEKDAKNHRKNRKAIYKKVH